jgi:hypothetical protein
METCNIKLHFKAFCCLSHPSPSTTMTNPALHSALLEHVHSEFLFTTGAILYCWTQFQKCLMHCNSCQAYQHKLHYVHFLPEIGAESECLILSARCVKHEVHFMMILPCRSCLWAEGDWEYGVPLHHGIKNDYFIEYKTFYSHWMSKYICRPRNLWDISN